MRFSLFFFLLVSIHTFTQDIIKMEKQGGVYTIPCKINGLPLKFIFDTGASDVSISLTEALFMQKNGYLKESDIKGSVYYSIANGDISEGTKINLSKIEVGKQVLYNVEASIVHTTEAPLLFGQSAMERFGKFTIDYENFNIVISSNHSSIKSVKIGTQTWMTENLNVDRFRNGDLIREAKSIEEWKEAGKNKQPVWCYYDNDPRNGTKYGKLYNWYAVIDPRGLSPEGWHIPTNEEWNNLEKQVGDDSAKKLKYTSGWDDYGCKRCYDVSETLKDECKACMGTQKNSSEPFSGNGNNLTGFSALPSGFRFAFGDFGAIGEGGYWWSSTEDSDPIARFLTEAPILGSPATNKKEGLSIRCVKNEN